MVKIAVAGGSGQVAREVIDALLATKKHEITILSRKDYQGRVTIPETSWKIVDYDDKNGLTNALQGTHTLLSFVQILSDVDQRSQKNLIDAAISAGVRRFAPSEYGSKGTMNMDWWHGKEEIRSYLKRVNENGNVLEYTLFQPGLFLDYLAFPYKTATHVDPLQSVFDFQRGSAIVVNGYEEAIMTLTTVADLAKVVALAVDHSGRWPTTSGIRGNRLKFSEIVEIGERVRGRTFRVEKAEVRDLEAGDLTVPVGLSAVHHSVSQEEAPELLKAVVVGMLLSSIKGAWDISDEMNRLFPGFQFTTAETFLEKIWAGKP